MSNNINSQNINSTNGIYEQNTSRFIQAPDNIPKYSLNKVLQEKDEFRSSVKSAYKERAVSQERKNIFGKVLAFTAGIGTFILLLKKKII